VTRPLARAPITRYRNSVHKTAQVQTPIDGDRIARQRQALITLTSHRREDAATLRDALQHITEVTAETLGVARVSVWRYAADGQSIVCADLFDAVSREHSEGAVLSAHIHPAYFAALAEAEVIVADDAVMHPQTREFADDYLRPLGIVSMLDAPIAVNGQRLGVVCHEHVGPPRQWAADEQTFAVAVANIVAAVLEADEREHAESAARKHLERFDIVVRSTSDAVWDWNLRDDSIWWSDGFRALFGHADVEAGIESWTARIHPGDYERVLTHVQAVIAGGEDYFTDEYRFQRANGSYADVVDRGFVIRDANGIGVRMIGAMQDISDRKQADRLVRDSAMRYQQLFDANPQPMWVYDLETLRFLAVNDAAIEHYGYSRAQFLAMTIRDIRPPEDLPRLRDALSLQDSDTRRSGLWRHVRHDGSIIRVEVRSHRVDFGGRAARLVLATDVTARLDAEERVRAQLDELVRWQRAMLAREDRVQLLKREVNDVLRESGREPRYLPAVEGGSWCPREPVERANGVPAMSSDVDRARLALLSVLEDEQRRTAELRESEARFRELAEAVTEVFWVSTASAKRILYVSPGYERVWGRSCESLYDCPDAWAESIYEEDRARVLEQARARQTEGFEITYRIVRPDGQLRWIHDRAFPVMNADGQVARVVGVARDMTEQRQLEEQFRQSQKMEAVGQLAGGVAHDFNNILTVMLMQIDLMQEDEAVTDDMRGGLTQVRAAAERAAHLTRQLLLFSRRQVMQPADVDINRVVLGIARMLQRIIGEDVKLQLNLEPSSLLTFADAGMLDQVLMNLSVNARDAMPDGGRLVIETATEMVDEGRARAMGVTSGSYVKLRVADSGVGIPEDVLPHIFEPFYTTKQPGKGTGLGLATVFGIVQQHNGWVHVDSAPGRGTAFDIYLPSSAATSESEGADDADAMRVEGDETVLVVEDESYVRALVRATLSRRGYRVIEAASGVEALTMWRTQRPRFDLLLTDLVMPGGVGGHELARALQADDPGLRVLFMSGYSPETAGRALELGSGDTFVQKPFTPVQLLRAVRQRLDATAAGVS
jgi:PAS domain S-box-containing protein